MFAILLIENVIVPRNCYYRKLAFNGNRPPIMVNNQKTSSMYGHALSTTEECPKNATTEFPIPERSTMTIIVPVDNPSHKEENFNYDYLINHLQSTFLIQRHQDQVNLRRKKYTVKKCTRTGIELISGKN